MQLVIKGTSNLTAGQDLAILRSSCHRVLDNISEKAGPAMCNLCIANQDE